MPALDHQDATVGLATVFFHVMSRLVDMPDTTGYLTERVMHLQAIYDNTASDEERVWTISSALMVLSDALALCADLPAKGTPEWCRAVGEDPRLVHIVSSAWDTSVATVKRHRAEFGD